MSMKTLPILFINMGGEMMYILDQRLKAQKIPDDKAVKVVHDIVGTMFNKRFIEELFKPQHLYSKKAMRTVFDRLAHASVMRLNAASMDKLYDLMVMAVKHQSLLALSPSDILLITLNHIDAIRNFVKDSQSVRQQVDLVYQLLIDVYGGLTTSDFYQIRMTILNFFQDMHIRVSIFLKNKCQTNSGQFTQPIHGPVAWGTEIPGIIRLFNENGNQARKFGFKSGGDYQTSPHKGSLDLRGDRVTKLGCNMYIDSKTAADVAYHGNKKSTVSSDIDMSTPDPLAMAQLDLLAQLIGTNAQPTHEFKLNLFETEADDIEAPASSQTLISTDNVVKINATKVGDTELRHIMGELNVDDNPDKDNGDDLLDLMDSALQ